MQTLIVVNMRGNTTEAMRERCRKDFKEQMKEGLVVKDDNIEIIAHTIQGDIGLEFNEEEEYEKESI